MKLDSSDTLAIQTDVRQGALSGIRISEPKTVFGPEIKSCPEGTSTTTPSWCYLYVHNSKIKHIVSQLESDKKVPYFVHRTTHHAKRGSKVITTERPTVSGLVFVQGDVKHLQTYLKEALPDYHLVNDCATHQTAIIPHEQMIPFMRIMQESPDNIRILLKPLEQYAADNTLLRITTGPMKGMEGYIVRINRNRHLVMSIGGHTIAIGNIHKEMFEVVEKENLSHANL
jgi:hypothetical protein